MKHIVKMIAGALPIALLGACATTGENTAELGTTPKTTAAETTAAASAAQTFAAPDQPKKINTAQGKPDVLDKRVIYFDYDKTDIRSEYQPIIRAHAEYLADHPRVHVRLEGHADERGTRDYNLALGERRGNSVLALLTLQGVREKQIDTVSYGEERPLTEGHDESSWRKNRRVEIVYR